MRRRRSASRRAATYRDAEPVPGVRKRHRQRCRNPCLISRTLAHMRFRRDFLPIWSGRAEISRKSAPAKHPIWARIAAVGAQVFGGLRQLPSSGTNFGMRRKVGIFDHQTLDLDVQRPSNLAGRDILFLPLPRPKSFRGPPSRSRRDDPHPIASACVNRRDLSPLDLSRRENSPFAQSRKSITCRTLPLKSYGLRA